MLLTQSEIIALTNKVRFKAQSHALDKLGIVHKIRAGGSVIVSRAHVEHLLGSTNSSYIPAPIEPDWNALVA